MPQSQSTVTVSGYEYSGELQMIPTWVQINIDECASKKAKNRRRSMPDYYTKNQHRIGT